MTVRLRAHHLLCILTFVGEGYTPGFVDNYIEIARRLSAGEDIEIVEGPDDICAPLLDDEGPHCHGDGVLVRDRLAAEAVSELVGVAVHPGVVFRPDATLLDRLRSGFRAGELRSACRGCEWSSLCTRVARQGYPGVRVAAGPILGAAS
ncbi:DUF1284 domain-containing protein [Mycoplana dimorpha]|uniref:2Fe-2S ferredoxin n=1 Tax=Mycoplana dimorpha TaxID=28320 RepID=A0A2T5BI04_MYCDI|nr:DUF1284 domain-containing protein [Mycoplana dimorpha]PTM98513.1 hypothetical protein C7449_101176 [Mycoplana dimorpha]